MVYYSIRVNDVYEGGDFVQAGVSLLGAGFHVETPRAGLWGPTFVGLSSKVPMVVTACCGGTVSVRVWLSSHGLAGPALRVLAAGLSVRLASGLALASTTPSSSPPSESGDLSIDVSLERF